MSTGTNNRTRVAILSTGFSLPEDDEKLFNDVITERERETASIVNQKEDGVYSQSETINSEQWFFEANQAENGFRKLFLIPALIAGAAVAIPHGLGDISGFTFTAYKAWVQNALGTSFRPIPGDYIEVTPTDIVITLPGGSAYDGFTGQISLDYIKG